MLIWFKPFGGCVEIFHISVQEFCDMKILNMNYGKKNTFCEDRSYVVSMGCVH